MLRDYWVFRDTVDVGFQKKAKMLAYTLFWVEIYFNKLISES